MKGNRTVFGLLLILPLISASQLLVDTSLLNNSNKWKPKIGALNIANTLKKVSLGPIETVKIDKGEKKVNREKKHGFRSENDAWGFVTDYKIEKRQPFDITLVYNGADSIFLNMNMVNKSEGQRTGIFHSKKELPGSGNSYTYCEETNIETNKDTTQWILKRDTLSLNLVKYYEMCSMPANFPNSFVNVEIWNLSGSAGDTILIYPVKGFGQKGYKTRYSEGLVFIHKDKQLAAYQFSPKYMWIRKDLKDQVKMILGGAVIALLSVYNN
ncbi:MAG: hypothetical protein ABIO05_05750 [Ferruginibacter sp.]